MGGVLDGLRVIEVGGIGPVPFACMMLADHGAEVIRIETPGKSTDEAIAADVLLRSRRIVRIDLKRPEGVEIIGRLAESADALVEGFRPGVMERLGLGPDVLLKRNPRLVYGRMTGWGQDGPYANAAGHDINYIALSGVLHAIGPAGGRPLPPLNLAGDFGGGGMMLAFGVVGAMLAVQRGAPGQVIDCAMTEGSSLLMSMMWAFRGQGTWQDERGVNVLDGGAHFYNTYETADGRFVSFAPVEPQFYRILLEKLGLADDPDFAAQHDRERWPALKERLAAIFRTRSRDEWCAVFEGTDACFAPVLSMAEAADHPHSVARCAFVENGGVLQPAPGPRFSATPPRAPEMTRGSSPEILEELGYTADQLRVLAEAGTVG